MEDASSVAAQIVSLFESTPKKTLSGSQLRAMLTIHRSDFEPLRYNVRNLRDFVRAYVPQVYESSRQGLDVIYSLAPVPAATPVLSDTLRPVTSAIQDESDATLPVRAHPRLWKLFVSPNAPYRLFVDPENLTFRELAPDEPAPSRPWVQVPPCPPAHHLQIGKDFLHEVGDPFVKSKLSEIVEHERVWWMPFFSTVRAFGLEKKWTEHRGRRLGAELARTLAGLGIPAGRIPSLRPTDAPPARPALATERLAGQVAESTIRRLAIEVVSRMSESELRELKLPLGDVIDVLGTR